MDQNNQTNLNPSSPAQENTGPRASFSVPISQPQQPFASPQPPFGQPASFPEAGRIPPMPLPTSNQAYQQPLFGQQAPVFEAEQLPPMQMPTSNQAYQQPPFGHPTPVPHADQLPPMSHPAPNQPYQQSPFDQMHSAMPNWAPVQAAQASVKKMPEIAVAIALALRFLTRIPVSVAPQDDTPENNRRALVFYPFAGIAIGLIAGLITLIADWIGMSRLLGAAIGVSAWVTVTGALHLDGLLDSFDGFAFAGSPERRLEIMKDLQHGTYALIGGMMFLMLKIFATAYFAPRNFVFLALFAASVARLTVLFVAERETVISPNGLAADLKAKIDSATVRRAAVFPILMLVPLAIVFRWKLLFVCLIPAAPLAVAQLAKRKIGGINGDVLGATIELTELWTLLLFTINPFS